MLKSINIRNLNDAVLLVNSFLSTNITKKVRFKAEENLGPC